MAFSRLAIIGPGLLGASIAQAFRRIKTDAEIRVWARSEERAEEARERAWADFASTDLREVVANSELILFCVPIGAMPEIAEKILPHISLTTILTDVGSVKMPVVETLEKIFAQRGKFVGSHPMAGAEQTGMDAARADLLDGAVCIITPTPQTDLAAEMAVSDFWKSLGCSNVRTLSPQQHDELVAEASHLPHLVASLLVNAISDDAMAVSGSGFRDTTRVASGSPEMWTEIFSNNRMALRAALAAMLQEIERADRILAASDDAAMNALLTGAKTRRDRLQQK